MPWDLVAVVRIWLIDKTAPEEAGNTPTFSVPFLHDLYLFFGE